MRRDGGGLTVGGLLAIVGVVFGVGIGAYLVTNGGSDKPHTSGAGLSTVPTFPTPTPVESLPVVRPSAVRTSVIVRTVTATAPGPRRSTIYSSIRVPVPVQPPPQQNLNAWSWTNLRTLNSYYGTVEIHNHTGGRRSGIFTWTVWQYDTFSESTIPLYKMDGSVSGLANGGSKTVRLNRTELTDMTDGRHGPLSGQPHVQFVVDSSY